MRILDDKEKKVVDEIIKYAQPEEGLENNIISILMRCLSNSDDNNFLEYNLNKRKVWVKKRHKDLKNDNTSSIIENVVPMSKIISFIDYLEKMNLISFVEYYNEEDLGDTSQRDFSNRNDYQEIKDNKIKKFIFDNIRSGIFDTQHLRQYKKDGYKTVEQVRHEKEVRRMNQQIIWAIAALIVTIIIAAISK